MLQRAHQYIAVETLVADKQDESKRPRAEQPRGHPSGPLKRRDDRSDMLSSRPPPIPLNSTRTYIFFQIREKGLLKAPNPIKIRFERCVISNVKEEGSWISEIIRFKEMGALPEDKAVARRIMRTGS
ncbi:hypothetical protein BHE74_00052948 [Ensete ventricosum]|nr:hypothetical protein BHE74_00052948 [Ensete ventricosum]